MGSLLQPLENRGIKFAATYIGESLGNVSGGLKRGAVYEGRLNLAVDVDLQRLAGLSQLTFHANVFQIHGGGLSRGSLQNLFVVSGIEALPTTLSAAEVKERGLVAYTAIYAPAGLRQSVSHVWRHRGRVIEVVSLAPVLGGRREGYRTYSRKTSFPDDAEGRWSVDVVTASGQLIGRLRFRIVR